MNTFNLKRRLNLTFKNQFGWSTKRKIIAFSVDDYGNVRMNSRETRDKMLKSNFSFNFNRFDYFDALEDEEDLLQLYECLSSVKDKNGNSAIFTTFSMSANPDFERIIKSNYSEYFHERLNETFKKKSGYENVPNLIQEGIQKRLIYPQFHGREHLNIKVFLELLRKGNNELRFAIKNKSSVSLSENPYINIKDTEAFGIELFEDVEIHKGILESGLYLFEETYGFKATHFASPGGHAHSSLEEVLYNKGIKYIDTDFVKREHQGKGVFKKEINYTGKRNKFNQLYFIRNCVYEPLVNQNIDWEDYCMMQIEIAFNWRKPVNISSHRVNFSGHIDPNNRREGLRKLKRLLKKIIQKWPDVEFMSTAELGDLIINSK